MKVEAETFKPAVVVVAAETAAAEVVAVEEVVMVAGALDVDRCKDAKMQNFL